MKDLKTTGIVVGSVIGIFGLVYFGYKKFVPENIKDAAATAIQYPAATRDIISGKRYDTTRQVEDQEGGSRKRKPKHRKGKTKKYLK